MALIQITEPGEAFATEQQAKSNFYAAGIDLGTTNSLIATAIDGEIDTLADTTGQHILPSVVRYLGDGEVIVGKKALDASVSDSLNTIISVKRLVGRHAQELNQYQATYRLADTNPSIVQIETADGIKTPIEISAEILKVLAMRAQQALSCAELDGVVITVPAYFNDAQRQATKDAAAFAGLRVLRLLNEPTAAAVAYGLDKGQKGIIVVFDLGGGTFDVSVLKLEQGVFRVLATGGDTELGGDDFDYLIAEYCAQQAGINLDENVQTVRSFLRGASAAKEALSTEQTVIQNFTLSDGSIYQQRLSRVQMNDLISDLVHKAIISCQRVLRDADIKPDAIQEVVMVGGSTRIPYIQDQVEKVFMRKPLTSVDPDRIVAIGAAIQANNLVGNQGNDLLLLDVTPLSLGIETIGGLTEKLIPRNTVIPATRVQEYTTYKDGQTNISIHVVQGERELVQDCRSLARFELKGIPPMVAGAARIHVSFQVDADGLLTVEAKETQQQIATKVKVKPSYGLSDDEIATMLQHSISYAEQDIKIRRLREQQIEARRMIESLDAALTLDADELLEPQEHETIMLEKQKLEHIVATDDVEGIREQVKVLEQASEFYVERRMNRSIQQALQGHAVNEFRDTE